MNPTTGVIGEAWRVYRAHLTQFVGIAVAVYAVVAVLGLLLSLLGSVGAVAAGVVGIIGTYWLQAAIVKAVEDVRDGRVDLSIRDTFAAVRDRIAPVLGASILAGIAIAIGLLLFIVPGLFLMTIWVVIIPIIVLERSGALDAFGRSRALVRGHGWNVFGVIVVTILLLIAVSIVIALVLAPLPDEAANVIGQLISGAFFGPFVGIAWTLLYFRLREARERAAPAVAGP
jgi:hypothetical protein